MLIVFIRSILVYIMLIAVMRLLGKRQLSELQPFELVITLIIAELACIPMADISIPLAYGIIPVFALFIMHLLITKLALKNKRFSKLINGKPQVVMSPTGIDYKLLAELDMDAADLFNSLRSMGYFNPADILYVIVETSGKLSVMPKSTCSPATPKSLSVSLPESALPYTVITEGKYQPDNLKPAGVKHEDIDKLLSVYNFKLSDILILIVTGGKDVYMQPYKGPALAVSLEVT